MAWSQQEYALTISCQLFSLLIPGFPVGTPTRRDVGHAAMDKVGEEYRGERTYGEGRKGTYILSTGIEAYAQAAVGPEYEYPACLPHQYHPRSPFDLLRGEGGRGTDGAMIALEPCTGGSYDSSWIGCVAANHPSSSFRSSDSAQISLAAHHYYISISRTRDVPLFGYQLPACVALLVLKIVSLFCLEQPTDFAHPDIFGI